MKQNNSRSVLKRYALFFFLVLIIPMFIICTFFVASLNNMLREKTITDKRLQMNFLTGNLNRQISNIVTCANRLSISNNIYSYRLSLPTIYGTDIINDLRTNVFSSAFTSDIYIFSTSQPYAYSSYSTYSIERFVSRITEGTLNMDEYTEFLNNIETNKPMVVYQKNVILLYFHFPVSEASSDMYIVFEIGKSMLREYIRSFSLPEQYLFYIHAIVDTDDLSHAIIYQSSSSMELYNAFIEKINSTYNNEAIGSECSNYDDEFMEKAQDYYDVALKNGFNDAICGINIENNVGSEFNIETLKSKYFVLADSEPIMGWNYYYAVPENNIIDACSEFQLKIYFVILLVLCCGNILVIVFTYASYKPVKNLKVNLERLVSDEGGIKPANDNEFQVIEQIAVSLHSSVQELLSLKGVNKAAVKQFIILRLIQGVSADYDTMKKSFEQVGLYIENEYFFVVTLHILGEMAGYDQYIDFIEAYNSPEDMVMFAVHGSERGQVIIVVSVSNDDIFIYQPFLNQLHQAFTAHFNVRAAMGAGLVYPELTKLSISYMQASMAYEYRLIQGYNQVLIFTAKNHSLRIDIKYQNLLNFFETAVTSCKIEEVRDTFKYIVDFVDKESVSLYSTRYICQNMVQIAASVFYLFPYPVAADFDTSYNLDKILRVETLEDFKAFMNEVSDDVCKYISSYLELSSRHKDAVSGKKEFVNEMAAYIDENIASSQLSIISMAEWFGLSTSYVSRVFKDIKGMTILEYVNDKRITMAQQLLADTDKGIELIVNEVGYCDTSSFIRKFKKIVGVTPGEFRKQAAAGELIDEE